MILQAPNPNHHPAVNLRLHATFRHRRLALRGQPGISHKGQDGFRTLRIPSRRVRRQEKRVIRPRWQLALEDVELADLFCLMFRPNDSSKTGPQRTTHASTSDLTRFGNGRHEFNKISSPIAFWQKTTDTQTRPIVQKAVISKTRCCKRFITRLRAV